MFCARPSLLRALTRLTWSCGRDREEEFHRCCCCWRCDDRRVSLNFSSIFCLLLGGFSWLFCVITFFFLLRLHSWSLCYPDDRVWWSGQAWTKSSIESVLIGDECQPCCVSLRAYLLYKSCKNVTLGIWIRPNRARVELWERLNDLMVWNESSNRRMGRKIYELICTIDLEVYCIRFDLGPLMCVLECSNWDWMLIYWWHFPRLDDWLALEW